jgi:hypothetical protein
VCEKVLVEWHNNVSKLIPKKSKKNTDFLIEKTEIYISRLYLIKYADKFGLEEGQEFQSAITDEEKFKQREELITYALKADMPKVTYKPTKKLEAMTTFKPFNVRELELDVYDSHANRVGFYQQEFEQKGLKPKRSTRNVTREQPGLSVGHL